MLVTAALRMFDFETPLSPFVCIWIIYCSCYFKVVGCITDGEFSNYRIRAVVLHLMASNCFGVGAFLSMDLGFLYLT